MTELKDFLPVIAILVSITGLLYQYFGVILKIREDMGREIGGLGARIASLETKIEPFWQCVEKHLVDLLKTYPTHVDKDVLLDKFAEKTLTLQEAERLRTIMVCEIKESADDKKLAYIMVLGRLESVLCDLRKSG